MARLDPTTGWEWLQHDLDGELPAAEQAELRAAMADDPDLGRQAAELQRLDALLRGSRIEVHPGFAAQVTRSLPAAGWEARHPRAWRLAVFLLLALGGASAALLGTGGARLAPAGPFGNALAAVGDLFRAAALTGAGLLSASWKGLGLVFASALTTGGMLAFAALVVAVNVGLFLLLRRHGRRPAAAVAASGRLGEPR